MPSNRSSKRSSERFAKRHRRSRRIRPFRIRSTSPAHSAGQRRRPDRRQVGPRRRLSRRARSCPSLPRISQRLRRPRARRVRRRARCRARDRRLAGCALRPGGRLCPRREGADRCGRHHGRDLGRRRRQWPAAEPPMWSSWRWKARCPVIHIAIDRDDESVTTRLSGRRKGARPVVQSLLRDRCLLRAAPGHAQETPERLSPRTA